jgi:hypothetical protein
VRFLRIKSGVLFFICGLQLGPKVQSPISVRKHSAQGLRRGKPLQLGS